MFSLFHEVNKQKRHKTYFQNKVPKMNNFWKSKPWYAKHEFGKYKFLAQTLMQWCKLYSGRELWRPPNWQFWHLHLLTKFRTCPRCQMWLQNGEKFDLFLLFDEFCQPWPSDVYASPEKRSEQQQQQPSRYVFRANPAQLSFTQNSVSICSQNLIFLNTEHSVLEVAATQIEQLR